MRGNVGGCTHVAEQRNARKNEQIGYCSLVHEAYAGTREVSYEKERSIGRGIRIYRGKTLSCVWREVQTNTSRTEQLEGGKLASESCEWKQTREPSNCARTHTHTII
jgi:hypothetical protein